MNDRVKLPWLVYDDLHSLRARFYCAEDAFHFAEHLGKNTTIYKYGRSCPCKWMIGVDKADTPEIAVSLIYARAAMD